MKKIIKYFKRNLFFFLLLFLEAILFVVSYRAGWLIGWDNCLPELNFKANFERSFFAIWQEYRGLGFFDGMAHAANIVHTLFLWFLSLFIPKNFLRYFFTFLMHFLGGVGAYKLSLQLLKRVRPSRNEPQRTLLNFNRSQPEHWDLEGRTLNNLAAFLTALFYLLNIGTIQMFYTPFEPFSVHFASLPWLSLFLIKFLQKGLRKDLVWLLVLSILATPQAFVPTIFIVCLLSVLGIFLFHFKAADFFKKTITVSLVIFAANAFWALPYFYGVFKNAKVVTSSKVNQMSTEITFLKNKAFGDFKSVALLYGYSLDSTDLQKSGQSDYMMKPWRQHLGQPLIKIISWFFFVLVILGIAEVLKKKKKQFYPFLALFVMAFLMLGNDIPVLSLGYSLLAKYVPFFGVAFRTVFTKFSLLYVFCYSLFVGLGLKLILNAAFNLKLNRIFNYFLTFTFYFLLFFYSWPVFKGAFFYNNLQVEISQSYFDLIEFFKTQNKNSRVLVLPQPSFWGWTYYNWGFRGSGFVWRGLPQASMDGAFLPWSANNENFYWQLSYAVNTQNLTLLESILEKYQINFLVLDKNIRGTVNYKSLKTDELKTMFDQSQKIAKVKEIGPEPNGEGEIEIYEFNLQTPVKDFVFLADDLPTINQYQWNDEDVGFEEFGHYLSSSTSEESLAQIYYPFRSLFTGRQQDELEFEIKEGFDSFVFTSKPINKFPISNYQLLIPFHLDKDESVFWTKELKQEKIATPSVQIIPSRARNTQDESGKIEVKIDKQKGYFSYDSLDNEEAFKLETKSCNPFNTGTMERKTIEENGQKLLRLTSVGSSNCLDIDLPYFSQKTGYLVKVESRHLKGKSLLFSINDKTSKKSVMETYLPKKLTPEVSLPTFSRNSSTSGVIESYFIIPPMEEYGMGYSLHFDNISIGRQQTINDLGRIEVYPVPYRFLKGIKFVSTDFLAIYQDRLDYSDPGSPPAGGSRRKWEGDFQVSHPNPSFYKVTINPNTLTLSNSKTLILSQSFHPGWIAWVGKPLFGKRLKDHVLINNWSNGWKISDKLLVVSGKKDTNEPTTIYLFFWPQVLEYFGFGLLLVLIIWLILSKRGFYGDF